MDFSDNDWETLTEDNFKNIFKHSPVKRTGYKGLMRNLRFIKPEDHETPGE
jgi:epoxyqueuosine reductase